MLLEALKWEVSDSFWALTLMRFRLEILLYLYNKLKECLWLLYEWEFVDSISSIDVDVCWKRINSSFINRLSTH